MSRADRLFEFHGTKTGRNLSKIAREDQHLKPLRDQLKNLMKDDDKALAMVEDMLAVALHGAGEHYLKLKGAAVERIVKARMDLLGIFEKISTEGARADVKKHLPDLKKIYDDLNNDLGNLQKPLDADPPPAALKENIAERIRKEVAKMLPGKSTAKLRPIDADKVKVSGKTRLARYRYRKIPGRDAYKRIFDDKAWVELEVQGNEFHARTFDRHGRSTGEFHEHHPVYQPYGSLPRTGDIFQFHHGIESRLMDHVFGKAYRPDAAPTICLRNRKEKSPHQTATRVGGAARGTRTSQPRTYLEIRAMAMADLMAAQVPPHHIETYLAVVDAHVRNVVAPKLREPKKSRVLASFK
jgi:hypothetical protein